MTLRRAASLLALLLTSGALSARAQTTSTAEEHQHWVAVLHALEAHPEDPKNTSDAEVVFKRLVEVTDFHMVLCPVITELPNKYSHVQPIMQLFTLGLAGYQIEVGKTDNPGANLYALHSVLKGYANLLATNPKAHDKKLDALARMDADGKLPDLIEKRGCK